MSGINREEMKENNAKVQAEMNNTKPEDKIEEVKTVRDKTSLEQKAGNLVAESGTVLIISGIATAGVLITTYVSGLIGLSTMITIAIMLVTGYLLTKVGSFIGTGSWGFPTLN